MTCYKQLTIIFRVFIVKVTGGHWSTEVMSWVGLSIWFYVREQPAVILVWNVLKNGATASIMPSDSAICCICLLTLFDYCKYVDKQCGSWSDCFWYWPTLFVKKLPKHFSRWQEQTTFVVIGALWVKSKSIRMYCPASQEWQWLHVLFTKLSGTYKR